MEAVVRFGLLSLLISCAAAWTTFTVPHTDGQDDVPILTTALLTGNFSKSATILFARGIKYNIFTPIRFPALTNVEVRIEGNLSYPENISTIQSAFSLLMFFTHMSKCSSRREDIVGSSVSILLVQYARMCNSLPVLHLELSRIMVSRPHRCMYTGSSETDLYRFAFTGGNNVTLRGSIDPDWGWGDGHGQAVSRDQRHSTPSPC